MDVRGSVLDASLLHGGKRFLILGCFVFEFLEERFETTLSEPLVDLTVCIKKFFFGPILDGNRSNRIGVEDVEYYNICVTAV